MDVGEWMNKFRRLEREIEALEGGFMEMQENEEDERQAKENFD